MKLFEKRRRLLEQLLSLGRAEPAPEVLFGIETQYRQPVILHAGYRRLEAVALKAGRLRLGRRNPLLPRAECRFLASSDAGRDYRGDRGGPRAAGVVAYQMNV